MPPAAATAAARRTQDPRRDDTRRRAGQPYSEAKFEHAPHANHTKHATRAPRRTAAATAVPARPRTAPRPAPRTAPRTEPRPRTAPHAEPTRRRTQAQTRVRTAPRPRSLRIEARLLDRIVRGRAWIPVLGIALIGIVAMRVEVLKLNAGVGAEMQQVSQLASANAVLQQADSALSEPVRIESIAARDGMVIPPPTSLHFIKGSAGEIAKAISRITPPDPSTYYSNVVSERQTAANSESDAANTSAIGIQTTGVVIGAPPSGTAAGSTDVNSGATGGTPLGATNTSSGGSTVVTTAPTVGSTPTGSTTQTSENPVGTTDTGPGTDTGSSTDTGAGGQTTTYGTQPTGSQTTEQTSSSSGGSGLAG